jgi:hypothetical protein
MVFIAEADDPPVPVVEAYRSKIIGGNVHVCRSSHDSVARVTLVIGEVGTLIVALAAAYLVYWVFRVVASIVVNAITGVAAMYCVNLFLYPDVGQTLWSLVVAGIGGFPGVIAVVCARALGFTV